MERRAEMLQELESLIPIAKSIHANFGENCEVVIHDLRHPESSLVFIIGAVTNRKIGAPVTNIVLETLRNNGDESEDLHCYRTITKDGKILKSSTTFIRNDKGKIVGCFCINFDLTTFYQSKKLIDSITLFPDDYESSKDECFARDVTEAIENIINQVLLTSPKPVAAMQKEEKIMIVKELDMKGVFLVKGAVDYVAEVLGVSKFTIYNYLDEVRSKTEGEASY